MGEFFKGWRRKIGVVMLVMACVFTALWVRGLKISDEFNSTRWTRTSRGVSFENGPSFISYQDLSSGSIERHVLDHNSMRVQIIAETWIMEIVNIPHWSIVLPLTLLSTYLLLVKPRPKKPAESS